MTSQPLKAPPPAASGQATPAKSGPAKKLSIIIKTYNEEDKIETAIRSALSCAQGLDAEVIVADSLSTDTTVAIAARYPVLVVQLTHAGDRSCGAGPQLGFQFSCGDYIYLMDGDMELNPDFLRPALLQLDGQPDVAGVGGVVEEKNIANLIFQLRKKSAAPHMKAGVVDRLNMGGCYRRKALEDVGYFSNLNLHSFEELELALRLQAHGWRLLRLPILSVKHYGHALPLLKLLRLRMTTNYVQGPGEFIRAALGKPYFFRALMEFRVFLAVIATWLLLVIAVALTPLSITPLLVLALLIALVAGIMIARKDSVRLGLYALLDWNLFALGTVRGFLRKPKPPEATIRSRIVHEPATLALHKTAG